MNGTGRIRRLAHVQDKIPTRESYCLLLGSKSFTRLGKSRASMENRVSTYRSMEQNLIVGTLPGQLFAYHLRARRQVSGKSHSTFVGYPEASLALFEIGHKDE
jgi:hypothetical protein